jgi:sugar lactone lactonase YvrE
VAAEGMGFPNGSVITPDGETLIVAETLGLCLTAFDIAADGTLSNRRLWASVAPVVPDGICLDADGAIWVASALGPECVRVGEGGNVLEKIDTGQSCFACMLGGDDGKTLFMLTAPTSLAHEAEKSPKGNVLISKVDCGRAGRP